MLEEERSKREEYQKMKVRAKTSAPKSDLTVISDRYEVRIDGVFLTYKSLLDR